VQPTSITLVLIAIDFLSIIHLAWSTCLIRSTQVVG